MQKDHTDINGLDYIATFALLIFKYFVIMKSIKIFSASALEDLYYDWTKRKCAES
jgi:hypothetical protein